MSTQNDKEAYCLASTYNLCPPHAVYPALIRRTDAGKYEPDHTPAAATRCMVLAHYSGKTNVIIQYNPALNLYVPFHVTATKIQVTGTLTPNSAGDYIGTGIYNSRTYSVLEGGAYILWRDEIDKWIISAALGSKAGPYWYRTHETIEGIYYYENGAEGNATAAVITGTLTPAAAGNYSAESEYKDKPTYANETKIGLLWWNGTDRWIISNAVGWTEGPYWAWINTLINGEYSPYGGATGIATVAPGEE